MENKEVILPDRQLSAMTKALSGLDHVMWCIHSPKSPNTITGIMRFKERLDPKSLKESLRRRLLAFPKFRQKVVMKKGWPHWEEDELFDLDCHIHHIALPEPGDYKTLQELIGHLIGIPIDTSKPLWKVHLIDGYEGGSVLLWRIQHAIGDGIALMRVVFSVTASNPEESLQSLKPYSDGAATREEDWFNKILEGSTHWKEDIQQLWNKRDELAGHLKDFLNSSLELGKWALGNELDGPAEKYRGEMSLQKVPAWSTQPMDLTIVKNFGKQHCATVNDVLLALLTGALRRHLLLHGYEPEKGMLVSCPVNLRGQGEPIRVENKVGSMPIELPVHMEDFMQRLELVKEQTQRLKHSFEPVIAYNFVKLMGDWLPQNVEGMLADRMSGRISAVVTNVPGPKTAVYLAGQEVEDLMFWVPQTKTMGMGISIISYNNKVYVGVVTDPNIVNDPDLIIESFNREVMTLLTTSTTNA